MPRNLVEISLKTKREASVALRSRTRLLKQREMELEKAEYKLSSRDEVLRGVTVGAAGSDGGSIQSSASEGDDRLPWMGAAKKEALSLWWPEKEN